MTRNHHGALKGTKIKSPKILVGFFEDWRGGMEEYAQANAVIAPPKAWGKAVFLAGTAGEHCNLI